MKVTTSKGKTFIKVDGDLTVARAADFKDVLVSSLNKADTIVMDLDEVTSIDLASLQLMCSAHLTASNTGKTLTVKDPSVDVFLQERKTAGFIYSKPCSLVSSDDCLWIDQGEE